MFVYYDIKTIVGKFAHVSFVINKNELADNNKDIRLVVRDLINLVRRSKGALGLLELRGSEYWIEPSTCGGIQTDDLMITMNILIVKSI